MTMKATRCAMFGLCLIGVCSTAAVSHADTLTPQQTGAFTTWAMPILASPRMVAASSDAVYFSAYFDNVIGRITP